MNPIPYTLSAQLLADGDPVRCLALHAHNVLLAGSQSGLITRFSLRDGSADIQPGRSPRHPHHVTALLSSDETNAYATGCKDGIVRIMDGTSHECVRTLVGHDNAVTSLDWDRSEGRGVLISGSWDGTARLWDVDSGRCLVALEGHENTVSVAGLGKKGGVATGSAGVARGNSVAGHSVRIWNVSNETSRLVSIVSEDHSGPIRDVCYDAKTGEIYTCSNDGTVKIRSSEDGKCHTTLACPYDDAPMLLSVCVVDSGAVVAAAEDGNVIVWDGGEVQVIPHPGCVWDVLPMKDGDFCTACHDGYVRVFTRDAERMATAEAIKALDDAVKESRAVRSSGPTSDEIAKLPKWEMNALTQGRSEGQVQLFQKTGRAIAAQWSEASRTWIEVGEVTGTKNSGSLNGKTYDHVLPIEIDRPDGSVVTLQIGYNNGENPFVTAQAFIDEHALDQGYLAQIADYIRQRAGETGPTIGAMAGGGASAPAAHMEIAYDHLPMRGYTFFDAGVDKRGLTKVVQKIREFNERAPNPLSSADVDSLDSLCETLSVTNRYHSSTISNLELIPLRTMIVTWDASHVFPALDLARMTVLHPDAARADREGYWKDVLGGALTTCLGLGDGAAKEVAVPMLTMRLVCNCYRGGSGAANAVGGLLERVLDCIAICASSDNKNVRLAVATAILNTSSFMHVSSSSSSSASSTIRILDMVGTIAGCGKYESEAIARILVALGTVLLIPGPCGEEAQRVARERGMVSMLERSASGNDVAVSVAKEIRSVLS